MAEHWTDQATERPIFTTVIRARDSDANIFDILGKACSLMRQLDIPKDRIGRLSFQVMHAPSYDEAVALIEHWFPVDRNDA